MALGRVKRILLDSSVCLSVFFLLIVSLPNLPPEGSYTTVELEPLLERTGAFAPNKKLNAAVKLFEDEFSGPESIAHRGRDNELFMSMNGGYIVKVYGEHYDHFQRVVRIGPGCAGPQEEEICGRPLGLRFARDGRLLVADSYLGIWAVDVDTGAKELLVDPSQPVGGRLPRIIDDLDEDSEGHIYWSDASSRASLQEGSLETLVGPSGRLVKRDSGSGHNMVLMDGLGFANGVQLSPEEDFVLVCETACGRVLRYWLRGPKTGSSDVFIAGLPGYPDNIRARPQGGYLLSLVVVKDPLALDTARLLAAQPQLRRLLARLLVGTRALLNAVTAVYDNPYTSGLAHKLLHLSTIATVISGNRSMVIALAPEGTVEGVWEGDNGAMFISETLQVKDKLFFGSPYSRYLGMLDLSEGETPEDKGGLSLGGEAVTTSTKYPTAQEHLAAAKKAQESTKTVKKSAEKVAATMKTRENSEKVSGTKKVEESVEKKSGKQNGKESAEKLETKMEL